MSKRTWTDDELKAVCKEAYVQVPGQAHLYAFCPLESARMVLDARAEIAGLKAELEEEENSTAMLQANLNFAHSELARAHLDSAIEALGEAWGYLRSDQGRDDVEACQYARKTLVARIAELKKQRESL